MKLKALSSAMAFSAMLFALGIAQQAIAEPGFEEPDSNVGDQASSALTSAVQQPESELEPASVGANIKADPTLLNVEPDEVADELNLVAELLADLESLSVSNESTTAPIVNTTNPLEPEALTESLAGSTSESASELSQLLEPESVVGQITSVSQLSDVQPTDWAYQAVESLVERYSCIVGYPDQTYRGDRSLTRYEFAAGLNACLDNIAELIASATENAVTDEDLATIQRLQAEFASELTTLREQVDTLTNRTATLEAQQFSTTTTLRGNVWFNLTQAFPTGEILAERSLAVPNSAFAPPSRDADNRPTRVERDQPQATGSYYTWLNLTTSFTGSDALVTQLVVGNSSSPANQLVSAGFFNSWGTPFLDQTGTPTAGDVTIRELFYSFPVGEDIQIDIGPRLNYYRYFDGNQFTFFLTGTTSFNSTGSTLLNAIDRGTGVVFQWQIVDPLELTVAYLAENVEFLNPDIFNTASDPTSGLFNSSNTISAQLEFRPTSNLNLRLIYARSSLKAYNGFIGGAVGEPLPYGYADDGFGGTLRDSGADAFVANFDWLIDDWIGVFGRYSYGRIDINPANEDRSEGEIRVQSFQVGLGFPDLGKEGALGVVSFLVPHDYLEGRRFLLSGGGDGGTQYELEASYRYPINSNIALIPTFYTIWNPNNFDSNPTVFVGNMRMQFTF
ncbi:MAG: iron uptake porin [Elainellaceae cyanobacterium]